MLDIQQLRKNLPEVLAGLKRRGLDDATLRAEFIELEEKRKDVQSKAEYFQSQRNAKSKEVGVAIAKGDLALAEVIKSEVKEFAEELKDLEAKNEAVQQEMAVFLRTIPNIPRPEVPTGKSADENVEVRKWGTPKNYDFKVRDHVEIGESLGGIDFDTAAKLSGARFSVLKGGVARLHRALGQFMLNTHTMEHGYTEVYVPYMVKAECIDGVTSLKKFENDLFSVNAGSVYTTEELSKIEDDKNIPGALRPKSENKFYLISTAEIPVTNFVRDSIVDLKELPLKFACHSPCFRSEAGSYGKDTRGMIRQHQFDKVEVVQIVHPEKSAEAHEQLVMHAETILQKLGLPYRTMLLCTGDMGFSSAKTYDLEVWLPAQNTYREISSCSNYEAFQARRMMARFKNAQGKTELLHTINGSGLAVGRTLVAVLENYQNADGSVTIPQVLVPYMGGVTALDAAK